MNKMMRLVRGELVRLQKNKILPISIAVSLIWVLIIVFSSAEEILGLLPVILAIDAGMLGVIYLAASFYLEKQEGSVKSLFVSPLSSAEILISKIIASMLSSLGSAALIVISFCLAHDQKVNVLFLVVNLLIVVFAHSVIGFAIILNCRDFAQMLGIYAAYALLFFLPSVLYILEIIPEKLEALLLLSPTHSSFILLQKPFWETDLAFVIGAYFYLILLGAGLYFYVNKKFKIYAVQG